MNPSQADMMTTGTFQMNGGSAFTYDSQEFSDQSNVAGPGGFPTANGARHEQGSDVEANGTGIGTGIGTDIENGYNDGPTSTFVYTNEKRFSDFHALFRSVPDDEKLIEDYGCALQKEILVQGRLYISENHVCFNANIFGWVTNLVIAFSEITAIEKRLTAFVIPNAISIVTTTNTKGHFFASFLSRDAAHDLLMAAWRKSFPCAANASALSNNVYFRQNRSNITLNEDDNNNNTDADSFISARPASDSKRNRHRRSSSSTSQNWTADEAEWDEFEDIDGKSSVGSRRRGFKPRTAVKIMKGTETHTGRSRAASDLPPPPSSFDYGGQRTESDSPSKTRANPPESNTSNGSKASDQRHTNGETKAKLSAVTNSNRTPTTCKCSKDGRHYANTFLSEIYPGSIESMWKLLFESDFSKSFLTNEVMKGADVQEEAWQKTADGTLPKTTKYTKWLGMPIGPKTTKAILTDVCENKDFDQYVTTVTTTSTPDVPSGGCFTTKCRTCITWAGPNQVQVLVTGAVEFTKSSWIKSQIEKGAAEGMATHYKELNQCIRKYIATHPEEFAGADSGVTASQGAAEAEQSRPSRSRSSGRHRRANGELGSDQFMSGDKSKVSTDSSSKLASAAKDGKTGDSGILSSLSGVFSLGDSESTSHLALIGVLFMVILANMFIWLQISSVTSQIEKLQDDVFSRQQMNPRWMYRDNGNGHSNNNNKNMMFVDDDYSQEQEEEAMWAWLTEREERHRQYQRANAQKDWIQAPKSSSKEAAAEEDRSGRSKTDRHHETDGIKYDDLSATEAKLQARIDELQLQLKTLEQTLETGAQM
ncbi:hypothetical protein BGZ65_011745 [Modicella reniformis]|uniref:VASt domain-containing protein n=1 Tax=Modicella reniformis TaxID=1440133 RepID=A0A9P6LTH0_9FUNG|nr:hypothetical protein BGZ65_011745 [Modicella reniformis]